VDLLVRSARRAAGQAAASPTDGTFVA